MQVDESLIRKLITTASKRVVTHAEELTVLDQSIGDGDHGLNMKRGFEAVLADIDTITIQPLPQALQAVGTKLVMTVGGASGPLFGTLFLALGKAMPADPTYVEVVQAFASAIASVQARGKSEPGQKTMLDVLAPVRAALAEGRPARATAAEAAAATIPMRALRGRASFLGDRSIGHMDPGARSSQLIVEAILDVLEGKS
jgi:phosphoenolpyruvate---glycerone phosphotransferase subunit DhaL